MHDFYLPLIMILLAGCLAGLSSGLLGAGGGLVMVPLTSWVLLRYGIPMSVAMHVAVGTSLAVMILSSTMSVYRHHKHNNIPWGFFRKLLGGLFVGAALGATLSSHLPGALLHSMFAVLVLIAAIQMAMNMLPRLRHTMTSRWLLTLYGVISGVLSASLGIGGSIIHVPFYRINALPMKQCVATSSASAIPIAIVGASIFMFTGMHAVALPKGSIGFVNVPIAGLLSLGSIASASLGAKWANKAKDHVLRLLFASFLVLVGMAMLFE